MSRIVTTPPPAQNEPRTKPLPSPLILRNLLVHPQIIRIEHPIHLPPDPRRLLRLRRERLLPPLGVQRLRQLGQGRRNLVARRVDLLQLLGLLVAQPPLLVRPLPDRPAGNVR